VIFAFSDSLIDSFKWWHFCKFTRIWEYFSFWRCTYLLHI